MVFLETCSPMNRYFLQLQEAMQNTRADYNMLSGGGLHRTEGVSLLIALSFSFTGGEEGLEFCSYEESHLKYIHLLQSYQGTEQVYACGHSSPKYVQDFR